MSDLLQLGFSEASKIAQRRDPRRFRFGYFAWYETPSGDSGRGSLLWFESRSERLGFFTQLEAAEALGLRDDVSDDVRRTDSLNRILADAVGSGVVRDFALNRANAMLRGTVQLRWWGNFGELLRGDSFFAKEVRTWHRLPARDATALEELEKPIRSGEIDAFLATVSTRT
jgi:hypothetical protein